MAEPKPLAPRGRVLLDEPLARHTSWRVGGPADRFFEPADRDDLVAFIRQLPPQEPLLWLGLGSNLLVRDGGFRGTVIALHGALDALRQEDDGTIFAEAGVHCARLAKLAERSQLAGLGFMAGIPGTVGGALAMNAGAWGDETWTHVLAVDVIGAGGATGWCSPAQFAVSYRTVVPPPDFCGFLAARFRVTPDADGEHAATTRRSLAQRKATQPVGRPSAGSTFRNPPGDHAARLIEACGLKGVRRGGAVVSSLHANFILTEDGATAADVEALIAAIISAVRSKTGVELHPEIRVVGEPANA